MVQTPPAECATITTNNSQIKREYVSTKTNQRERERENEKKKNTNQGKKLIPIF